MVPSKVRNIGPKCTLWHPQCASSTTTTPSTTIKEKKKPRNLFCAFGDCGYTDYDEYYIDHDYHDHDYIMIGYLYIDIKGNVYNYSSAITPVNSVCVVTCVVVTARRKREEAPDGDAVTVLGARPIYQRRS
jgi:hypothetical protein